ncbi:MULTISPECIES: AMP-binding protein [unclassified Pseudomonas]|uniref:AMP-binding protein n=1 Tax=Pseudomonas TaxID=286 RepID=UPI0008715F48|nr:MULTISPECIES: AMP-binding protein [unclassified Pseudomonas]SCW99132.1 crotonobetaine/carnitine-CoA ligase [Pseudomonas sp. NFACC56-3]SFK88267.1 crotonobetaine/carnitine-CoA ligase [Pseudomonas sp. NFACC52]
MTAWSVHEQRSLPALLAQAATQWPDSTYLDFSGELFTFAQTRHQVGRLAGGLRTLGVAPGDRVCVLMDNSSDFVFLWFAVNQLDAVFVPINVDMKGEFLRHQLADAGANLLVAEEHYAQRILSIETGLPEATTLLVRGNLGEGAGRLRVLPFEEARADAPLANDSRSQPGDLAMLVYTSGTTGPSKGCMITHNYACHFASQVASSLKLDKDDVHWSPCPLFHCAAAFGVVLSALYTGSTAAVAPRFSASRFWEQIEQSRASIALLLSVMLTLIPAGGRTEVSERCRGRLRAVYGVPLTGTLIAQWKELFGLQYVVPLGYGLTEACLLTITVVDDPNIPEGASGRKCEAFDVRILDEHGHECAPGTVGEVVVRPNKPDIMFTGYWRNPQATAACTENLWFHTGDLGSFDEQGYFFFADRKKDCLRRGGENISSFEVEQAFLAHPDIAEVAAHAIKSEVSEDELKITLVLRSEALLSEEELWRWAGENLPKFAVPRFIEFRASLPRTQSGRVKKYLLREEGITATTWYQLENTRSPKAAGI